MATTATFGRQLGRVLKWLVLALMLLIVLVVGWVWWGMQRSRPTLEGTVQVQGLSAPVSIVRDADGVPTLTAATRTDLAFALGWLHAQERLFQMDTLRRLAAGELSELSGSVTEAIDRRIRLHRFRARAKALVAAMDPAERAMLAAYVAGVRRGAAELGGSPYEYVITRSTPELWQSEDTVLAVFAMYLNLQPSVPQREMERALAMRKGGRALADFLFPLGTVLDAPLDGSVLPEAPMPASLAPMNGPAIPAAAADIRIPEMAGSNNWAVGGALTASGAALVANDMHLGLNVPSIWYRARLVVKPSAGSTEFPLDATGVTLPGTPFLVAGSNGKVAWGYTNSYIDTIDAVIVEWVPGKPGVYRTPAGEQKVRRIEEPVCVREDCTALVVEETVWGPIVGKDAFGRSLAMRWTAHDMRAVRLGAALEMERAATVAEALSTGMKSGIPQQNLTVGDSAGSIGWTIIGRVPKRYGFDGQDAVSFADGSKGWAGDLTPDATPRVVDPADARIWTANSRVLGGEAYALLGDGGYDTGARAGRIRELLLARQTFTPKDFLAIQLDDVSTRNRFWQQLMLAELQKPGRDARLASMIPYIRQWGERAVPESVGYRLIDTFRRELVERSYEGYLGKPEKGIGRRTFVASQAEGSIRRLLTARPAGLVPPGYASWDALIAAALAAVADDVRGPLERHVWGKIALAGVSHPLAGAIKPLGWFVNPRDVGVPGDRATVRAQAPGFGASERFAVSPGREGEGLFHMPGGQSGNPLAPYYLGGHEDWVQGRPTPFLPGPARWTLTLTPGP